MSSLEDVLAEHAGRLAALVAGIGAIALAWVKVMLRIKRDLRIDHAEVRELRGEDDIFDGLREEIGRLRKDVEELSRMFRQERSARLEAEEMAAAANRRADECEQTSQRLEERVAVLEQQIIQMRGA